MMLAGMGVVTARTLMFGKAKFEESQVLLQVPDADGFNGVRHRCA